MIKAVLDMCLVSTFKINLLHSLRIVTKQHQLDLARYWSRAYGVDPRLAL